MGLKFEEQKIFQGCENIKPLRFDFFVPDLNTAIEYDGQQHFEPVDFSGKGICYAVEMFKSILERDRIKDKYCSENNINLLRISYTEYKNIHNILKEKLMT